MTNFKPFKSLRPHIDYVKQIAALPYDVYSRDEAAAIVKENPQSFLAIDRPESTLEIIPLDIYSVEVYNRANLILTKWKNKNYLIQDATPSFYIYELTMGNHSQTGLVGLASVEEYYKGSIKKHEQTRQDKEDDRINHIEATNAHTGPIFLAHKENPALHNILTERKKNEPLYDFVSEDGVSHRIWQVSGIDDIHYITDQLKSTEALYIADGHHRCAAAAAVSKKRKAVGSKESNEADFFLSVLFSEKELQILPYHRVIKDIAGYTKDTFIEAISKHFKVTQVPVSPTTAPGVFGMYLERQWYKLEVITDTGSDAIARLDVYKLQTLILNPLLGIEDPKTDSNLTFVGGIKTIEEIEAITNGFPNGVAFTLYPTSINDLFQIADNNEMMPPKSTWFEPKLRSGLFIHEI